MQLPIPDATGDLRPTDGPLADFTPHPTGAPDGSYRLRNTFHSLIARAR